MNFIKFILIILILLIFSACSNYRTIENIGYIKAQKTAQNNIFKGIVKAKNAAILSFQTHGEITYLPYTTGDFIKKGGVIAKLDDSFYQIQKNEELAKLQEYQVLKNKQKRYYARLDILHKEGAISDNDWESAYFELKTLDAQIKSQKEKIKYINKELFYNSIIAPFDGYIADKYADIGAYAQVAAPIVNFISSDKFQVEIMIGENAINKIKLNDTTQIFIQDKKFEGKISHISKTSANSGGYLIKIAIDKIDKNIKEGMSANVKLAFDDKEAFFVPFNAVFQVGQEKYIYKISKIQNNEGTIEKAKVKTGKIINEKIEILEGINENDLIITTFSKNLENRKIAL